MISIIIPLYNKSEKIMRCMQSILSQTYVNFEVIIINDGSTDNSLEIVENIKDERIIIYTTKNKGVVSARNLGIKNSNNPIICFLDADDFWLPNHLQTIIKLTKDYPHGGLYTTKYSFFHSENQPQHFPTYIGIPEENWRGIVTNFYEAGKKYRLGCTGSIAIPKQVLDQLGGFDESMNISPYGEDIKLWIKIAIHYPVVYDSTHTLVYDLSGENHLSKNNLKKRTYANFNEFVEHENKNLSLKKYLDMFRTEFALKQKIAGNINEYRSIKKNISSKNLNWKEKFLFSLPSTLLQKLYHLKSIMQERNIKIDLHN